jgi:hypothetical protein
MTDSKDRGVQSTKRETVDVEDHLIKNKSELWNSEPRTKVNEARKGESAK